MNRPTSDSEIIKARTPLYLVGAGTLIAVLAIIAASISENNKDLAQAAFGLAGTAIAGAAGLAQSNGKQEENQPSFENHGLQVVKQDNNGSTTEAVEPAPNKSVINLETK
ncbi:conserved hypothetical protein [Hyella patelloides LEGE 07179]|uniref:Uncharacterized protein n=1 Tax=Hyella patelloides LEGE 07179 TaxID=945734 RepID=A0A563VWD3_9CYAN|nr:hypothetical protein [Hyella patelloides]VEP15563.1 conserved hypothetical protein [Hyella patelloides LEGE 07179]